jgi:hypothetical protein
VPPQVRVYTVWLPMLATDSRGAWQPGTTQGRQFWDPTRVVGKYLASVDLGGLGYAGVIWDAWFLFGAGADWGDRPPAPLGSGSTVTGSTGDLARAHARV